MSRVKKTIKKKNLAEETPVIFSMIIPKKIHRKFKIKSAKDGKKMCQVLLPLILKYIK